MPEYWSLFRMHLNECLSLAKSIWESKSHPFLSLTSPHSECVLGWVWKSTTNFHNHEEMKNRLNEHPWFGLLCWTFTAGGLILLLLPPRVTSRISYPRYSFASYLIFIQGERNKKKNYTPCRSLVANMFLPFMYFG